MTISNGIYKGTCTHWNVNSGYGFIRDDSEADHFVHFSNLIGVDFLNVGQRVRFREGMARGRAQAVDVEVVES